MTTPDSWRPTASPESLRKRAALLRRARQFFDSRGVMEVETPILGGFSVTDTGIRSMRLQADPWWLRTSPEYHMKRLLAAGCPDIYQIAKVFRAGEAGRRHQPEFTLAEWYRHDFTLAEMINETCAFIGTLHETTSDNELGDTQLQSYREAFRRHADIDPFTADLHELQQTATTLSAWNAELVGQLGPDRAAWLDLIASHKVYPELPTGCLQVITDFPAEQAMLARTRPEHPEVAERFEIFLNGVELANGFHELEDSVEQRRRFEADNQKRDADSLPVMAIDQYLLDALGHGLPDCCGVAVGMDRLQMLAEGFADIAATLSFRPGH